MKAIDHKLWRDLWRMKGQALAIALVVMCGIGNYIMFLSTLESLSSTQAAYYRDYRFAEVFASLKRAPESLRRRIADIPGVDRVQTRVAVQVRVDMPDFPEPVSAAVVSLPERGVPVLNGLHLRAGRLPAAGRADEVVASHSFATAHRLRPGSRFDVILNGRRQTLTLVGTALSPEFIQQMRPGSVFPDSKRYGILWMGRRSLGQAYNLHDAFNDLALSLDRGASVDDVIARVDALIRPYGGLGAYGREHQISHRFLSQELAQLATLGRLFPAMFMAVAAFLLNVVIGRQVAMQREQIATLKAFGYGNLQVLVHYLKSVAVINGIGIVGGIVLGNWLGRELAAIFTEFYHFPYLSFGVSPGVALEAILASLLAAGLGTFFAVWRAANLRPAVAMRPETPPAYRETWIERIGTKRWLSQPARMILRHIQRRALKSVLTVLGIALACGLILTGLFQRDTVGYMVYVQFGLMQREDLSVTFTDPTAYRARFDLVGLPGVRHVEPYRAVPVRFRHGHLEYRGGIRGFEPGGDIQRLLDADLRPVALPGDGILLTDFLGGMLDVRVGERIVVEVLEGNRPTREVVVAGLVNEFVGVSGYMELAALNRFLREGPTISGAYLGIADGSLPELLSRLRETPRVAGVAERRQEIRNFNRTMDESMLFFTYVATVFSVVIAFGVIYNNAQISLAESGRELASLRVLGFTRGEIAYILLGELGLLTLLAIPLGLGLGEWMCYDIARTMQSDLYRVPVVLEPQTYAFAAAVVLVSAVLSGLAVRRRLDRLDLVAVLKAAE
ncbi:MAG: FtsX-like permease family protein [Zoogloeaceae bacterium]|nr:FtsX-like permease family protein [Rhodocyclaceae bacterium]MCP5235635.1 FtsX-like permease family protein [Zoogloeaceae bacterium]